MANGSGVTIMLPVKPNASAGMKAAASTRRPL